MDTDVGGVKSAFPRIVSATDLTGVGGGAQSTCSFRR